MSADTRCFACNRPALTPVQEAAPTMLTALRTFVGAFHPTGANVPSWLLKEWKAARAAIANAEGR